MGRATTPPLRAPALAWRLVSSTDGEWLVAQHLRRQRTPQEVSTDMPVAPELR